PADAAAAGHLDEVAAAVELGALALVVAEVLPAARALDIGHRVAAVVDVVGQPERVGRLLRHRPAQLLDEAVTAVELAERVGEAERDDVVDRLAARRRDAADPAALRV